MEELEKYLDLYKEKFNKDFVYNMQFDNSKDSIIKIIKECLSQNIDAEEYYIKYANANLDDALELIAKLIKIPALELRNYTHDIDGEPNLIYVSIPMKGGDSFIIDKNSLQFLYANSSVSLNDHLEEYKKGTRSKKEDFNS